MDFLNFIQENEDPNLDYLFKIRKTYQDLLTTESAFQQYAQEISRELTQKYGKSEEDNPEESKPDEENDPTQNISGDTHHPESNDKKKERESKEDNEEQEEDEELLIDSPDEINNPDLEKKIKSYYRAIALVAHPDKQSGREELFKEVVKAKKEKDLLKLLIIADKLEIIHDKFDTPTILCIEQSLLNLENKTNKFKKSVCWHWGTSNDEIKDKILHQMAVENKLVEK